MISSSGGTETGGISEKATENPICFPKTKQKKKFLYDAKFGTCNTLPVKRKINNIIILMLISPYKKKGMF